MGFLSALLPSAASLIPGIGPIAGKLVGAGLSAAGAASGAIGGMPATQKVDQTTTQSGTQTSNGTSSNRRFMSDGQSAVMGDVGSYIQQLMANPGAAVAPARTATKNSINNNFVNAGQMIRGKFKQGGGNASGKAGRANREAEMTRLGGLNDADLNYDQKALDLQQLAAQLGLNFSNINLGNDASTNATATSNSTSNTKGTTTSTQPGGVLGGAVNGGLGVLSTLIGLNKMMAGGGGGGVQKI